MIKSKQWNFRNLFTKFIWMEIKVYLYYNKKTFFHSSSSHM